MVGMTSLADRKIVQQSAAGTAQLWDVVNSANGDAGEFCRAWLALQCGMILGATAGLLLMREHGEAGEVGRYTARAAWPDGNRELESLAQMGQKAAAERRSVIGLTQDKKGSTHVQTSAAKYSIIALPVGDTPQGPLATIAVMVAPRGAAIDPQAVVRQLHWGSGWLELAISHVQGEQNRQQVARAAAGLDLVAVAGSHRGLAATAMAVANEIAERLACDRVSIGLVNRRRNEIHLRAVSHSAILKRNTQLAALIENAMEEALDQRAAIVYPPPSMGAGQIVVAQKELAKASAGQGAVLSVPLSCRGRLIGALTLEWHRDTAFDENAIAFCAAAAELLGPYFDLLRQGDRWLAGRTVDVVSTAVQRLVGPKRPSLKLGAIVLALVAVFLPFLKGEHRISAKSVTEGIIQRTAAAPFEGFIKSAPVRAGDIVHAGDVLASMEDRDLKLERLRWMSEVDKAAQKNRDALAKHDRAEMVATAAALDQAQAQLALAEERLARAQIRAPFDGIVVAGDLSQNLGAPVEKGKVLFEIAPLDAYRLILQVDERDVPYVQTGETGTLTLTGLPAQSLALRVVKLTPVATAEDGRNFFRTEAALEAADLQLRPGMEGVAKIDAGRERLLWIWTHSLIDWLRLMLWKWWL